MNHFCNDGSTLLKAFDRKGVDKEKRISFVKISSTAAILLPVAAVCIVLQRGCIATLQPNIWDGGISTLHLAALLTLGFAFWMLSNFLQPTPSIGVSIAADQAPPTHQNTGMAGLSHAAGRVDRHLPVKDGVVAEEEMIPIQNEQPKSGFLRRARESSAASLASLARVSSSASFAKLSTAVKSFATKSRCFTGEKPGQPRFISALSASESFVPIELIGELTLEDFTTILKYVQLANRVDFDDFDFVSHVGQTVRKVILLLDSAVCKSRGANSLPAKFSGDRESGDIDALLFAGVMRIFAEWRAVRVVPEEYKAYAVGMNLAKRDLISNIGKMEIATQQWIQREISEGIADVYSPTIRQLLEFEIWTDAHPNLPQLKDKTAAVGLVWMTRQIKFQTKIFENLLDVPGKYDSAILAVRAAYKDVFDPFHGWIIQKIFNNSFNGAPPVEKMYTLMNPVHYELVLETARNNATKISGVPELRQMFLPVSRASFSSHETEEVHIEDESIGFDFELDQKMSKEEGVPRILHLDHHIKTEWAKFVNNLQNDWDCFVREFLGQQHDMEKEVPSSRQIDNSSTSTDGEQVGMDLEDQGDEEVEEAALPALFHTRRISAPLRVLDSEELDSYASREMTKAAHNHIEIYLDLMNPLLRNLDDLINEFGMNDPTKV